MPENDQKNQNESSAAAEMGDRLATIYVDRKVGGAVPLSVAGAESPIPI